MLALLLALPLAGGTAAAADNVIAVHAKQILTGAGDPVEGGYLVVQDGLVQTVGATEAPEGAWVIDLPDSTICAGLIDAVTALGSEGQLAETASAVMPAARAAETLCSRHSSFAKAARGGVTTVGLSPTSENLIGGRMAVVQTNDASGQAQLIGDGPLRMALTADAYPYGRQPTSRMGAMALLRDVLAQDVSGAAPVVVHAETADQIRVAASLPGVKDRGLIVLTGSGSQDVAADLAAVPATAILGPYSVSSSTRALRTAGVLEEAGVLVAFTAGGNPNGLRLTAALAVREGLSPEAALAAITSVPARILGVDGKRGTIEVGKQADFVVLTGHPLDLHARVEMVFSAGAPVELESE
jgi:imidazolonepropionase-like amidohydrolase